jgi:threonine synthase
MRLVSTAGEAPAADLKTALFQGLAPDGGLYMPARLDPLDEATVTGLRGAQLEETALTVARQLWGDDTEGAHLAEVIAEALNFPIPLVQLDERTFVLELFHGPTLAFKDVGARFMARLMAGYRAGEDGVLTVLVATSGDTGGAVAHAFAGLPHFRTVVLYPEGQVSPLQERQFTTLGGNVEALAVAGTFDDCQRLAKEALAQRTLREQLHLTSANSINIGRLLPQIFYYFHAWTQLPEAEGEVVVCTPCGNFGNLTAGLMAKRLGLPAAGFVAATNVNDVVPEYLVTGTFRPRPSKRTISSAMDVGNPSNFARMLALYDNDVAAMRRDITGSVHSDEATSAALADVFHRWDRVLDPHSAVGYLASRTVLQQRPDARAIFLSTAHAAKFADVVEPVIGRPVPLPGSVAALYDRERRVGRIEARLTELERALLADAAP